MLQNGDKIGPYTIRESAGQGGMATVYQAWHEGLHRFEALKVPRGAGNDPDNAYIHRLLAEARVAAGLQHPHIVAIHSVSEAGSAVPFFAMEWVKGRDLAKILAEKKCFSLQETIEILEPVADALDYAHSKGVVHRDIKPANILLEERAEKLVPRVVDFGISRAAEDEDGATKLTKSGMIVGTPEYMSPEQAGSGEVVDFRTDLYSLAVVAYEMLAGGPPFTAGSGVSRLSILISHVRDIAPLFDKCPGFPPAAGQVLLRALSKSPQDRQSSCHQFLTQLQEAASEPWQLSDAENLDSSEPIRDGADDFAGTLAGNPEDSDGATLFAPRLNSAPLTANRAPISPPDGAFSPSNATKLVATLEGAPTPQPWPKPALTAPLSAPAVASRLAEVPIAEVPIAQQSAAHENAVAEPISPAPFIAPAPLEARRTARKGDAKRGGDSFFQAAEMPGTAPVKSKSAASTIAMLAGGCGLLVGAALVFVMLGRNSTPTVAEARGVAPVASSVAPMIVPRVAVNRAKAIKKPVEPPTPKTAPKVAPTMAAPRPRQALPKRVVAPRAKVTRAKPSPAPRPRVVVPSVPRPPVLRPRARRLNRVVSRPASPNPEREVRARVMPRVTRRVTPRVAPRVVASRPERRSRAPRLAASRPQVRPVSRPRVRSTSVVRAPRAVREAPLPP